MQENKVQKSISMLYDMESSIYLMTRAINELDKKIASLGYYYNYQKPVLEKAKKPEHDGEEESRYGVVIGGGIGALIAIIQGIIYGIQEANVLGGIFGWILNGVIYALIGGGIGWLAYYVSRVFVIPFIDRKKRNKKQEELNKYYKRQCENYDRAVAEDKQRVTKELALKQALSGQRNRLIARRKEASEKLQKFYDVVNVAPRFRNIVAIACMDEFVRLEISNKFDGTDGLYYLVMQQLDKLKLWNILEGINQKLDSIIDHLDDISGRIDILDERLGALNGRCDRLIQQTANSNALLQDIHTNTALSLYHQERIEKEESYQSALMSWWYLEK